MDASLTRTDKPDRTDLAARVPLSHFFGQLASVVSQTGPFVTAYLPVATPEDQERSNNAIADASLSGEESALLAGFVDEARWRSATEETNDAMVAAVLTAAGPQLVQRYPEGVSEPFIERSATPHLVPVIEAEQRLRHHILAVLGEEGLDLFTVPRHGDPSHHHTAETRPERIAHLVTEATKATASPLVLLAGPLEITEELQRLVRLDVPIETSVETVSSSSDPWDLADAAVRHVSNDRAKAKVETLQQWRFERAHGTAPADLVATVDVLRSGRGRLLLLSADATDERQVWIGTTATDLAIDLEQAAHFSMDGVLEPVRMADGLIRSALMSGVGVQILPILPQSSLPGGVGVLCDVAPVTALENPS